jgi:L-lactate dehydrogenase complex protein LldE
MIKEHPHVGLLVTCLVDAMRPEIGFATLKLLEQAGCRVSVPETQTCCGQPALNSGARGEAQALAKRVVEAFEPFDYVVAASGSCLGTVKTHYPDLLAEDPAWRKRAEQVAAKSFEILSFLADVRGWQPEGVRFKAKATYHHTCAGLRELGIYAQPLKLLAQVDGLEIVPLAGENACCGFGGTFAVKYPEISTAIVSDKTRQIAATGADTLLAADLGCLMNIAGKLSREGRGDIRVFHPVEILAGMADGKGVAGR